MMKMKDDQMGGACSLHGGVKNYVWLKGLKERDHSQDLGINGRIMLIWMLRK
jgi:hypothetical protein